jgi:hypothetical protein
MDEILIFIASLCLTLTLFEAATRRRRPVIALAVASSLGVCAFISPSLGLEAFLISGLAGVPVGYLIYILSHLIPSDIT